MDKKKIQTLVDWYSKPTYDVISIREDGFETLVSGDLGALIDILIFKTNQAHETGIISRDTQNVIDRWVELFIYDSPVRCFYAYQGQEKMVLNRKAERVGYAIIEFDKVTKTISEQFKLANTIEWSDVMNGNESKSDYWDLLDEALNYKTLKQQLPLKYIFVKH